MTYSVLEVLMQIDVIVTALLSALMLLAGHYFPWRAVFNRELPRLAAYVYGVLAILLPVTGFLALNRLWLAVAATWSSAIAGGGVVLFCYAFDDWIENRRGRQEAEEREASLRKVESTAEMYR
jgi:hypothetical protein